MLHPAGRAGRPPPARSSRRAAPRGGGSGRRPQRRPPPGTRPQAGHRVTRRCPQRRRGATRPPAPQGPRAGGDAGRVGDVGLARLVDLALVGPLGERARRGGDAVAAQRRTAHRST
jgi:hypothetical protein